MCCDKCGDWTARWRFETYHTIIAYELKILSLNFLQELKSHIEHLNKNHKHELGIERARHRETRRLFEESQAFAGRLQMQLKV